jgi:hypothetical protein
MPIESIPRYVENKELYLAEDHKVLSKISMLAKIFDYDEQKKMFFLT